MNKQQLASKIWAAANEMRSKIEASEYKDYILGFIFYKFLSEQEEAYLKKEGATEDDITRKLLPTLKDVIWRVSTPIVLIFLYWPRNSSVQVQTQI